jgi:hypothetical protein
MQIILKSFVRKKDVSFYRIKLAWDGIQCCTLVNMVMGVMVP